NGYITYMRTDSTTLSESALTAAREQVASLFGADYVPPAPRRYERKVKNAQEAHEAIRPSGGRFPPAPAAPVRAEGEERAGGARGDSPFGRPLPHAPGRALGALPRRARALRADLDADGRVPDEGCAGADGLAADRGRVHSQGEGRVRR